MDSLLKVKREEEAAGSSVDPSDESDSTKPTRKTSRVSFSGIDVTISAEENARPKYEPSKVVFTVAGDSENKIDKNTNSSSVDGSQEDDKDDKTDSDYDEGGGPKRPRRQRRSGVVNSEHMKRISSATFLDNLPTSNSVSADHHENGISDGATSDPSDSGTEGKGDRKISYDSEVELSEINQGFEDDSDLIQNVTLQIKDIMEDAKESELNNGICKKDIYDEDESLPQRHKNGANGVSQREDRTRIKKDSIAIFIDKKSKFDIEDNASEDSFAQKPLKSSLAAHVRKDSIALTNAKMSQIRDIQRQYAAMKKENHISLWKKRKEYLKKYQLHLAVSLMFIFVLVIVSVGWHFHDSYHLEKSLNQRVFFDPSSRKMTLRDPDKLDVMEAYFGESIPRWQSPSHCRNEPERGDFTCLRWKGNAVLRIHYFSGKGVNCYNVTWTPKRNDLYPEDCFPIGYSKWYGPANTSLPEWPMGDTNFSFSSSDMKHMGSGIFSSAIDHYWLSSDGFSIIVDKSVPLTIKWNVENSDKICLMAKYKGAFYGQRHHNRRAVLNYTVCNGNSILDVHRFSRKFLPEGPQRLPSDLVLNNPIWSIQGVSKNEEIEENHILELGNKIKDLHLKGSLIELDKQWETVPGDLTFDPERFPNISLITKKLKAMNMLLSLKFSPYFSYNSESFPDGLEHFYYVKDSGGRVPGLIRQKKGIVTLLDVTNNAAELWVKSKMITLSSMYNIASFHMTYPEGTWFPFNPSFANRQVTPIEVRKMFSDLVTSFSNIDADVMDGTSQSQDHKAFIRIPTKISTTHEGECIVGAIETALTLGIMGYPYVLLDGNLMSLDEPGNDFTIPDRNLFIRWVQMASFFPAMKYVFPPWLYDVDSIEIAKNASTIHIAYTTAIIKQMKTKISDGEPIIRPIWWADSTDKTSHSVNDEFMVGDSLIVAPILCSGATERDIYLPAGIWSDQLTGKLVRGRRWLRNYSVSMYQVPYFTKKVVIGEDGG